MRNLRFYYDEYKKQLAEIKTFIQSVELQKDVISELEILEKAGNNTLNLSLQYSKIIKQVVESPIQYNAVIISVYGCFEQYIDNIFEEYCQALYDIIEDYDDFPKKMKEKHIKKLGDFLLNPQRYKNYDLTDKQAVRNAAEAFNNPKEGFENNKRLILTHGGNLKIEQITELASDLGIEEFERNVVSNYVFKEYFINREVFNEETYTRLISSGSKRLFEILDRLVEERNNVAHGWVESRIKLSDILSEYIDYMECLAESILEVLIKSIHVTQYNNGKMYLIGKPLKVIDHHILCINNQEILLHKGDYLFAVKNDKFKVLTIRTLQKDGIDIEGADEKNIDIGIGFEKRVDLNVDEEYEFYCERELLNARMVINRDS